MSDVLTRTTRTRRLGISLLLGIGIPVAVLAASVDGASAQPCPKVECCVTHWCSK